MCREKVLGLDLTCCRNLVGAEVLHVSSFFLPAENLALGATSAP